MKIRALGDDSFLLRWDNRIAPTVHRKVMAFYRRLQASPIPGVLDLVPAYADLKVHYDPEIIQHSELYKLLTDFPEEPDRADTDESTLYQIPVVYGGVYGPDLSHVLQSIGLRKKKMIELHTEREYLIYMLGFTPGFPYLGGMNKKIACHRKEKPALKIPAGSVGIAGSQTGIYPIDSPGGWQIIGRTPVRLFNPEKPDPFLVKPGDRIRFYQIQESEFNTWQND